MPPTNDELREYLVAILRCDGPEAARERLLLRRDWRNAHCGGSKTAIEKGSTRATATLLDHASEWEGLERFWDEIEDWKFDIAAKLQPWLDSDWCDIQNAARRIAIVLQHRDGLLKLWPESLDRSLFDQFLDLLVRPTSRLRNLQLRFQDQLGRSPKTQKTFQKFLLRVRSELPDVQVSDFIESHQKLQSLSGPPIVPPDVRKPIVRPAPKQPVENQKSGSGWGSVFVIFALVNIGKLLMNGANNHEPNKHPPTPVFHPMKTQVFPIQPAPGLSPGEYLPPQFIPKDSSPLKTSVIDQTNEALDQIDPQGRSLLMPATPQAEISADALNPANIPVSKSVP